jgi:6,7-dimethyl-8-ribityllumazine synthase
MLARKLFKKPRSAMSHSPSAKGLAFGIVAARFNEELVDALLSSTVESLERWGVSRIEVVRVPGSYEIPMVVMQLAKSGQFDALIALGVVIQGKTQHAQDITTASSINLQRVAIETGVPVIHQILSPRNENDARKRVKVRGIEAATTALEMAGVMKKLDVAAGNRPRRRVERLVNRG